MNSRKVPSSFRDPSGFLFYHDGTIYRQINNTYKEDYEYLIRSGLYKTLTDAQLLVSHQEVDGKYAQSHDAYKVIRPEPLSFISYPYEWCFSQLKQAAATMLRIQKIALDSGMCLKDSSAYNIQFKSGKAMLIDTLSFETLKKGKPWVAYKQFCQHFLAPLALMSYKDIRLGQLFRIFMDGVPLDLASGILPLRTRLRFSLISHIHLHAKFQKYFAPKTLKTSRREVSRLSLMALIDNLESAVNALDWGLQDTEWANYYEGTNYSSTALDHKKQIIAGFLEKTKPGTLWDLGANTGVFSRIASDRGVQTIAFDIDPAAVEHNFLECVRKGETNILPLVLDVTNPSPGIGWRSEERASLVERGPADTVLALALTHHLAISNNLPLGKIAAFFRDLCSSLIIEFVPKEDTQVRKLLATREDIFPTYTQQDFEAVFGEYFEINCSAKIKETERTLYLMHTR